MALVTRIADAAAIDGFYRSIDRPLAENGEEANKRLSDVFTDVKRQEERPQALDTEMREPDD